MRIGLRLIVGLTFVPLGWGFAQARSLSLEDRIAAQRAIEQVYWQHRIWPAENRRPKPALHDVLPEEAIRVKVENYLEESNALAGLWGRPITTAKLQNEMDRMIAHTKDAKVLQEIFDALGNDPFLIAETLARQTLSGRLIREAYHGNTIFDKSWSDERETFGVDIEEAVGPFTLATFAAPTLAGCTNDSWSPTKAVVPEARQGATAVWTGSEMIVWGGGSDSSGGRYNPSTDTWTFTSQGANVPTARQSHTAVWTGSEMIVWGGSSGGPVQNSGGRYNPSSDTWAETSTGANVPTARGRHTAVWTGTEMIVWGGYGGSSPGNTGGRYDPATDTWVATSTGAGVPQARFRHTAVWTGSEMIVWGGTGTGGVPVNSGGRYNPSTDKWVATSLAAGVPISREFHTAIWTGQRMIVWGGLNYSSGRQNTGARYDPQTDTWQATSIGPNVPSGREFHTAVWTGSEMIVWGGEFLGEEDTPVSMNTGGRYDPIADTWTETSMGTAVPEVRMSHVAVWSGTEMLVWGGLRSDDLGNFLLVATGARYVPAADTWAPMGASGVPEGRLDHTAVWTGAEMIVWGGLDADHCFGSGSRYVPAVDVWTPTSAGANAPAERTSHTAVWTGSEMIVWGGLNSSVARMNSGARYNPASDTWLPTSTGANVPEARRAHSAVWTGAELIVWGGFGQGTNAFLITGGRYNPLTDAWLSTSLTNVPGPRQDHTAVWTGSEMIVWGGRNQSSMNTGGRYRPATNTWATTTFVNAPQARTDHTAVWTGTEMVVWGGYNFGVLSSGGQYDPVHDTWSATTLGNAPQARSDHTAVWTGTEMIVWGGAAFSGYPVAVGRYTPSTKIWVATSTGGAPTGRQSHTSVFTGTEMIAWGGYGGSYLSSGGRYCVCAGATYYRDADGDGVGVSTSTVSLCSAPVGYVAIGGDCDDANASRHPGAAEACNGVDDDCDAIVDNGGVVLCNDNNVCTNDACQGPTGCAQAFNTAPCDDGNPCTYSDTCSAGTCSSGRPGPPPEIGDVSVTGHGPTTLTWTGLAGGASYDLATSSLKDLRGNATTTATCLASEVPVAAYVDNQPDLAENTGYYYLVRASNTCGLGSYGFDSAGQERKPTAACP